MPGVATAACEDLAAPASSPERCVPHPAANMAITANGSIPSRIPVALVIVMP
ncbi:hypothetical protein GCM10010319_32950 [Streptomyces blastmyceticus]|uniref:Uncharacterized protein n=1 Tax=Streptomyces blastmyceticus TaxID=68180 RepID=A0ABP3GV32_9ACTN